MTEAKKALWQVRMLVDQLPKETREGPTGEAGDRLLPILGPQGSSGGGRRGRGGGMSGIDTIACHLADALEKIEHLEEAMKAVQSRVQSLHSENTDLKQRVALLERERRVERKITVGQYCGLEVRVLNEDRGISEILFPNGNRTHVESSMVKRGGGSLLHQRSAG